MRSTLRGIFLILTVGCEQAALVRLRARHDEADGLERFADRLHRMMCSHCRRAAIQEAQLDAALDHQKHNTGTVEIFI